MLKDKGMIFGEDGKSTYPKKRKRETGISIIINGIPSERRVPASCSYIEIEDIWLDIKIVTPEK